MLSNVRLSKISLHDKLRVVHWLLSKYRKLYYGKNYVITYIFLLWLFDFVSAMEFSTGNRSLK